MASADVQGLLDAAKLEQMTGINHFVHPTVEGETFLEDMGVDEFLETRLLDALRDADWVKEHDAKWFCKLYEFLWERLYGDKKQWSGWRQWEEKAKKLSIVRTEDGVVHSPDKALFPPEQGQDIQLAEGIPGIAFVDSEVLSGHGRELLEKLGVNEFTRESVITSTILRGFESDEWTKWTSEELKRCLTFMKVWLKDRDWEVSADWQRRLGSVRVMTEAGTLKRTDECYFPEPNLRSLHLNAPFVVLRDGDSDERAFFKALGVADMPRVLVSEGHYNQQKPPDAVPNWTTYWSWFRWGIKGDQYEVKEIPALVPDFFQEPNPACADTLLSFLVRHWDSYYKAYLDCTFRWRYNRADSRWRNEKASGRSYLAWQLKETAWLPTTEGLQEPIFVPTRFIERVAGDLVCYVVMPNDWDKKEFIEQGRRLFDFLGLRTELDLKALIYLLKVAREHAPDEQLKGRLSLIYHELGKKLEDEAETDLSEVPLLTTRGKFEPARSLFWNDDPGLGKEMESSEKISFAWIPPKNVDRRYVERIFDAGHVQRLSKHLSRHAVEPVNGGFDTRRTQPLRSRAKYLYSLLKHHEAGKAELASEKLGDVEVWTIPELQVLLRLRKIDEKTVDVRAFYDLDHNRLLVTQDTTPYDMATELARAFKLDFHHIAEIEVILQAKSDEEIAHRFEQEGISLLSSQGDEVLAPEAPPTDGARTSQAGTVIERGETAQQQREMLSSAGVSTPTTRGRWRPESKSTVRTPQPAQRRSPSKDVERPPLPYEERIAREEVNLRRIMAFEEREGRKPEDIRHRYLGYDIKSSDERSGESRYIEVKSSSYVLLTRKEHQCAEQEDANYYVYVVDDTTLYIVHAPAQSCDIKEVEIIEPRWKILDWREQAEQFQLPHVENDSDE